VNDQSTSALITEVYNQLRQSPPVSKARALQAAEIKLLSGRKSARPVGVAVGRGGRLFVSTLYMTGNEASPVVKSDLLMITRADDIATAPFAPYEETAAPLHKLYAELENPSWQRRYRAHIELIRRGGDASTKPVHSSTSPN